MSDKYMAAMEDDRNHWRTSAETAIELNAELQAEIVALKKGVQLPAMFDVMVLIMGSLDALCIRGRVNEDEIRTAVTNRYTSLGLLPPDARTPESPPNPVCQRKGCGKPLAYKGARFCGAACTARFEAREGLAPDEVANPHSDLPHGGGC